MGLGMGPDDARATRTRWGRARVQLPRVPLRSFDMALTPVKGWVFFDEDYARNARNSFYF